MAARLKAWAVLHNCPLDAEQAVPVAVLTLAYAVLANVAITVSPYTLAHAQTSKGAYVAASLFSASNPLPWEQGRAPPPPPRPRPFIPTAENQGPGSSLREGDERETCQARVAAVARGLEGLRLQYPHVARTLLVTGRWAEYPTVAALQAVILLRPVWMALGLHVSMSSANAVAIRAASFKGLHRLGCAKGDGQSWAAQRELQREQQREAEGNRGADGRWPYTKHGCQVQSDPHRQDPDRETSQMSHSPSPPNSQRAQMEQTKHHKFPGRGVTDDPEEESELGGPRWSLEQGLPGQVPPTMSITNSLLSQLQSQLGSAHRPDHAIRETVPASTPSSSDVPASHSKHSHSKRRQAQGNVQGETQNGAEDEGTPVGVSELGETEEARNEAKTQPSRAEEEKGHEKEDERAQQYTHNKGKRSVLSAYGRPRDLVGFGAGEHALREVGRKVWWALLASDWTFGSRFDLFYLVHVEPGVEYGMDAHLFPSRFPQIPGRSGWNEHATSIYHPSAHPHPHPHSHPHAHAPHTSTPHSPYATSLPSEPCRAESEDPTLHPSVRWPPGKGLTRTAYPRWDVTEESILATPRWGVVPGLEVADRTATPLPEDPPRGGYPAEMPSDHMRPDALLAPPGAGKNGVNMSSLFLVFTSLIAQTYKAFVDDAAEADGELDYDHLAFAEDRARFIFSHIPVPLRLSTREVVHLHAVAPNIDLRLRGGPEDGLLSYPQTHPLPPGAEAYLREGNFSEEKDDSRTTGRRTTGAGVHGAWPPPATSEEKIRLVAQMLVHYLCLRSHRFYMSRGFDDPTYARSSYFCVNAAWQLIRLAKRLITPLSHSGECFSHLASKTREEEGQPDSAFPPSPSSCSGSGSSSPSTSSSSLPTSSESDYLVHPFMVGHLGGWPVWFIVYHVFHAAIILQMYAVHRANQAEARRSAAPPLPAEATTDEETESEVDRQLDEMILWAIRAMRTSYLARARSGAPHSLLDKLIEFRRQAQKAVHPHREDEDGVRGPVKSPGKDEGKGAARPNVGQRITRSTRRSQTSATASSTSHAPSGPGADRNASPAPTDPDACACANANTNAKANTDAEPDTDLEVSEDGEPARKRPRVGHFAPNTKDKGKADGNTRGGPCCSSQHEPPPRPSTPKVLQREPARLSRSPRALEELLLGLFSGPETQGEWVRMNHSRRRLPLPSERSQAGPAAKPGVDSRAGPRLDPGDGVAAAPTATPTSAAAAAAAAATGSNPDPGTKIDRGSGPGQGIPVSGPTPTPWLDLGSTCWPHSVLTSLPAPSTGHTANLDTPSPIGSITGGGQPVSAFTNPAGSAGPGAGPGPNLGPSTDANPFVPFHTAFHPGLKEGLHSGSEGAPGSDQGQGQGQGQGSGLGLGPGLGPVPGLGSGLGSGPGPEPGLISGLGSGLEPGFGPGLGLGPGLGPGAGTGLGPGMGMEMAALSDPANPCSGAQVSPFPGGYDTAGSSLAAFRSYPWQSPTSVPDPQAVTSVGSVDSPGLAPSYFGEAPALQHPQVIAPAWGGDPVWDPMDSALLSTFFP